MRLLFKRGRGESARRSTRSGLRELKVFSLYRSRAPSGRSTRCPVRPIKLIEREAREPFELSDLDSLRDFQLDQIVSRELSQLGQPRGMRGMRGSRRPLGKVREGRTSLDREKLLGERTGKTDPPEQPPLWFSRRGGGGPSDSRGRSPPERGAGGLPRPRSWRRAEVRSVPRSWSAPEDGEPEDRRGGLGADQLPPSPSLSPSEALGASWRASWRPTGGRGPSSWREEARVPLDPQLPRA